MSILRESKVEKSIADYASAMGLIQFKFTSPGRRGVPDRAFIKRGGGVLFIEIKRPGKRPNPLQERQIRRFREQRIAAGWVDSVVDGIKMITDFAKSGLHPGDRCEVCKGKCRETGHNTIL